MRSRSLAGCFALVVLLAAYVVLRRRRKQHQARKEEDYVPGMRDGLEPIVAAPATGARDPGEGRGLRARLRAIDGPLAGRIFFLGNGSGVIGTSPDATVQIDLTGWETAPELVRIWSLAVRPVRQCRDREEGGRRHDGCGPPRDWR